MADDREIRVTVTGRDKISALLAGIQKKLDNFGKGRGGLSDVQKALDDYDRSVKGLGKDLDSNNTQLARHRSQVNSLAKSYHALKTSISDALHNRPGIADARTALIGSGEPARRGPGGRFLPKNAQPQPSSVRQAATGFLSGLREAQGTQKEIKARASQGKEEVKTRAIALEAELRTRQIEIAKESSLREAAVRQEIAERRKAVKEEIATLNANDTARRRLAEADNKRQQEEVIRNAKTADKLAQEQANRDIKVKSDEIKALNKPNAEQRTAVKKEIADRELARDKDIAAVRRASAADIREKEAARDRDIAAVRQAADSDLDRLKSQRDSLSPRTQKDELLAVRQEIAERKRAQEEAIAELRNATAKEIEDRKAATETEIAERKNAAKQDVAVAHTKLANVGGDNTNAIAQLEEEIAKRRAEVDEEISKRRQATDEEIVRLKASADDIRGEDRTALDERIKEAEREFQKYKAESLAAVRQETATRQTAAIAENRARQVANKAPNVVDITKDVLSKRNLDQTGNAFERLGVKAGRALGDIRRGFESGKTGLTTFKQAVASADTPLAKIGTAAGQFVKNMGSLVNLRWFILISALQLIGTLVVQLGAALVAIASSAAVAGAALGAAFAAGLGQAIVTGGLLKLAFDRIKGVLNAVKLADQARQQQAAGSTDTLKQQRTAAEQLADAHYALKQAIQGVSDAQYSEQQAVQSVTAAYQTHSDAIKNLAIARQKAARDIVDATLNERDAALSLKEAELAVVEAKQKLIDIEKTQRQQEADLSGAQTQVKEAQARVNQLKAQGASAQQILAAQQQLTVAQNAVSDIQNQQTTNKTTVQDAQLAVKRAQLSRDQAVVQNKRAIQDGEKTKKQGISGNQQVIDAQRQLKSSIQGIASAEHELASAQRAEADAVHGVAVARRSLRDASSDAKTGSVKAATQANLKVALAGLSPAEKTLFNSIERIKKVYKEQFRGITDIIIGPIAKAVDRVTILLKDPKILAAARTLATSIGKGISQISKFTISPSFRKEIETLATTAAQNLPKVVTALLNIVKAFLSIATSKGAIKIFDDLLDRIDRITGKFAKFTGNKDNLDKLLGVAKTHLDSWLNLGGAIGKVLGALIHDSSGEGKSFVDGIASALDRLAKFLNSHQAEVGKFFSNLHKSLQGLGPLIGGVFTVLFKAFTSPQGDAFTKIILKTVIPGLALMFQTIGLVASALITLFKIPFLGPMLELGLQVAVAEKALNKVFPVTQKATDALQKLVFHPKDSINNIKKFGTAISDFSGSASKSLKKVVFGDLTADGAGSKGLVGKFKSLGEKMATGFTGGFSKAGNAIKNFTTKGYQLISGFVVKSVAKIAALDFAAMASSFGAALKAMIISIGEFGAEMTAVFLTPPLDIILLIGAIIAIIVILANHFGLLKPALHAIWNAAKVAFGGIVSLIEYLINWVKHHWKLLLEILLAIFLPGAALLLAIYKWRTQIINWVIDLAKTVWGWFKTLGGWIIDVFVKLPGKIIKYFIHLGSDIVHGIINAFTGLSDKVINAIKDLPDKLLNLFKDVGKKIAGKIFSFLPKSVLKKLGFVGGVISGGIKVAGDVGNAILHPFGAYQGGVVGSGKGKIGKTDTVPAMLTPGEWVLNSIQQSRLAKLLKSTSGNIKKFLFDGQATGTTGVVPAFTTEGDTEDFKLAYEHNAGFAVPGPYKTKLTPTQESAFQKWLKGQGVQDTKDYDMRGYWRDDNAAALSHRPGTHFPDTYKTPYDTTFSNQSKYATGNNPFVWAGNNLIDRRNGDIVFSPTFGKKGSVKALLTPGEWVIGPNEQKKVATRLHESRQQLSAHLFGTGGKGPRKPGRFATGNKSFKTHEFTLVPEIDADNNQLWFLEFGDRSWGQVTNKDAEKIISSDGDFIPTYARRVARRHHGIFQDPSIAPYAAKLFAGAKGKSFKQNNSNFALGGMVGGVKRFAAGGPVTNTPGGPDNSRTTTKHINVTMQPRVEGDTDWHYVMKVAALAAEGSF